jgi:hypothetical protein
VSATDLPSEPIRDATDQLARRPPQYRSHRLDGAIPEFHRAVDALDDDTVPYTYYLKVLAGRDQPPAERTHCGPER